MPESNHDYARITGDARAPVVARSSLVSWWDMREGSGSTAFDYEDGNDGTINGAVWTTDAKTEGQALDFDGTDDWVDCGLDIFTASTYTMTCWVKFDTLPGGTVKIKPFSVEGLDQLAYIAGNDTLSHQHWDDSGGGTIEVGSFSPSAGVWYHMAGTYDGDEVAFFVDGSQNAASTGHAGSNLSGYSRKTAIGRYPTNTSQYVDGVIDDVRWYNAALSDTQINDIYNNTK